MFNPLHPAYFKQESKAASWLSSNIALFYLIFLIWTRCCLFLQPLRWPKTNGLRKSPGWEDGRRRQMRAVCRPRRACFWISDQKLQRRPPPNHGLPNICCHITLNYLFVDPAECMYPSPPHTHTHTLLSLFESVCVCVCACILRK